jgi:hypothetical protein
MGLAELELFLFVKSFTGGKQMKKYRWGLTTTFAAGLLWLGAGASNVAAQNRFSTPPSPQPTGTDQASTEPNLEGSWSITFYPKMSTLKELLSASSLRQLIPRQVGRTAGTWTFA